MNDANRTLIAQTELDGLLRDFISPMQRATLHAGLRSEEASHFSELILNLAERIKTMPQTYDTDGQGENAIVHLHYFRGSFDAWVTEKDRGDASGDTSQYQAYGFASFGGKREAEAGYIGIAEIINADVELDLYWEPKPFKDVQ